MNYPIVAAGPGVRASGPQRDGGHGPPRDDCRRTRRGRRHDPAGADHQRHGRLQPGACPVCVGRRRRAPAEKSTTPDPTASHTGEAADSPPRPDPNPFPPERSQGLSGLEGMQASRSGREFPAQRRAAVTSALIWAWFPAVSVWGNRLGRQHLEMRRPAGADPPVRGRQCHC